MRLGIVADDFTGACDAAGAFGSLNHALVLLEPAHVGDSSGADVIAVDLNVREQVDAQTVALKAEQAARALADQKRRVLLKIDSTLRGPLGPLVDGAFRGSGAAVALIAPAFPAQGRFMRGGQLHLADGTSGARVVDLLGADGRFEVGAIGEDVAQTPESLAHAVRALVGRGVRRIVLDASETQTLRAVALAWQSQPEWLLVGSAGLAREIAVSAAGLRQLGDATRGGSDVGARPDAWAGVPSPGARDASTGVPTPREREARAGVSTGTRRHVLVVAGSPAAATRAQIAALTAAAARASQREAIAHARGEWLQRTRISVIAAEDTDVRDAGESSHRLAHKVADRAVKGRRPLGLVIAGGATARAVCDALGVHSVLMRGELEPGIPHGRLNGGIWHGLPMVTKAGAFGHETALLDAARALGVSCEDLRSNKHT